MMETSSPFERSANCPFGQGEHQAQYLSSSARISAGNLRGMQHRTRRKTSRLAPLVEAPPSWLLREAAPDSFPSIRREFPGFHRGAFPSVQFLAHAAGHQESLQRALASMDLGLDLPCLRAGVGGPHAFQSTIRTTSGTGASPPGGSQSVADHDGPFVILLDNGLSPRRLDDHLIALLAGCLQGSAPSLKTHRATMDFQCRTSPKAGQAA